MNYIKTVKSHDEIIKEGFVPLKEPLDDPDYIHVTGEGNTLCYIPDHQIWFYSSPYAVLKAEFELNKEFITNLEAPLGIFFKYLKLPEKMWDYNEEGWSVYNGEINYGYQWVDFFHGSAITRCGKPVLVINYVSLPHFDYLEEPD